MSVDVVIYDFNFDLRFYLLLFVTIGQLSDEKGTERLGDPRMKGIKSAPSIESHWSAAVTAREAVRPTVGRVHA